jgi:hypothetical protein
MNLFWFVFLSSTVLLPYLADCGNVPQCAKRKAIVVNYHESQISEVSPVFITTQSRILLQKVG